MNRSSITIPHIGVPHVAVPTLGAVAASACVLTASALPATQGLTTAEVRGQFAECGYQLANSGLAPSSRYIALHDQGVDISQDGDHRVAMAIVYADVDAALAAHKLAHQRAEQTMGGSWPFSNDNGPQLLAGYGGTVWRGNVALVESSSRTLYSMYAYDSETDETRVARPELFSLGFVSIDTPYAVDRDFVACLENAMPVTAEMPDGSASSDDSRVETTSIAPDFIRGHPW